jgi:vacuolar-type H+-ATPase subunit H
MRATISATLTPEAYRVYKEWSQERKASDEISRAMTESFARENLLEALKRQRDIYRSRSGNFKRLYEEIDAGLHQDADTIKKQIQYIFEKHPFAGEEQKTLEEF